MDGSRIPPWVRGIDDLMHVPDRVLAVVIPSIHPSTFVMALKTAAPELKSRVFQFLSEDVIQAIRQEMECVGPVRLADVERAQGQIVYVVNCHG